MAVSLRLYHLWMTFPICGTACAIRGGYFRASGALKAMLTVKFVSMLVSIAAGGLATLLEMFAYIFCALHYADFTVFCIPGASLSAQLLTAKNSACASFGVYFFPMRCAVGTLSGKAFFRMLRDEALSPNILLVAMRCVVLSNMLFMRTVPDTLRGHAFLAMSGVISGLLGFDFIPMCRVVSPLIGLNLFLRPSHGF